MKIFYVPLRFSIKFAQPVFFNTMPMFVMRSIIGCQLRSMCCISSTSTCPECMYNKTCAYAYMFETILTKDNSVLAGCDRASHPFTLSMESINSKSPVTAMDFTFTLIGEAIEYLPYVFGAVIRAAKAGVLKQRTPFTVTAVSVNGTNILTNEETIRTDVIPSEWSLWQNNVRQKGEILVQFLSPLRFKTMGRYISDFDAVSFMKCLHRRMMTISTLYGTGEQIPEYKPEETQLIIVKRKLQWVDIPHYSARQKDSMKLGGVIGELTLSGTFTSYEILLLEFAKLFQAGKNTNFGLGKIDYWARLQEEQEGSK